MSEKQIPIPEIAQERGMTRLVFEDDFDSLDTIDLYGTGDKKYKWYTTRPFRATPLTPDDFRIENSVLYLEQHDSLYNYGLCTYNPRVRRGFSFNKGVLEFRFRIPHYYEDKTKYSVPDCGGPAIWSFPIDKIQDTAGEWVEMDWMEYWGTYDGRFPEGYYTTTLHHSRRENMHQFNTFIANNATRRGVGCITDAEWHTMTFLWDDGILQSWFDGMPSVVQRYGAEEGPDPKATIKGELPLNKIYTPMDIQHLPLIINGAKNNPLEIDWIRVWQK